MTCFFNPAASTPREMAASSPRESRLTLPLSRRNTLIQKSVTTPNPMTAPQSACRNPPAIQNASSCERFCTSAVRDAVDRKNILKAVPASRIRETSCRPAFFTANRNSTSPLQPAPSSAIQKFPTAASSGNTEAHATNSTEPCVIPRMDGSAIGFRKIPCIITPLAASSPPHSKALSARGKRTLRMS